MFGLSYNHQGQCTKISAEKDLLYTSMCTSRGGTTTQPAHASTRQIIRYANPNPRNPTQLSVNVLKYELNVYFIFTVLLFCNEFKVFVASEFWKRLPKQSRGCQPWYSLTQNWKYWGILPINVRYTLSHVPRWMAPISEWGMHDTKLIISSFTIVKISLAKKE